MAKPGIEVRLVGDGIPDSLEIRELRGTEQISKPFDFRLDVVAPEGELDVAEVMGSDVTLLFERGQEVVRKVHGMVVALDDRLETKGKYQHFFLRVAPHTHTLSLVKTQETYMDLDVAGIVAEKLGMHEIEETLARRLIGKYPVLDFVTQYDETDLAFISRLTEHAGISFIFEHDDDKDVLVLVDDNAEFTKLDTTEVKFEAGGEQTGVFELEAKHRLSTSLFMVQDYNHRDPSTDLIAEHVVEDGFAGGEVEYGGHFKTVPEGVDLARIRAEQRRSEQLTYVGRTSEGTFSAGACVDIVDHPSLSDLQLLVVRAEHHVVQTVHGHGDGAKRFETAFHSIPRDRPFRPECGTPRPKIDGVVTGIIEPPGVTGTDRSSHHVPHAKGIEKATAAEIRAAPASNQAQIDADGQYLVRLHFDTAEPRSRVSRPIRMAQPHAGPHYGMHFPLKPGVEVAVAFINGDPDRPVILGAVPNTVVPSVVRGDEATLNRLKSESGVILEFGD